MAVQLRSTLMLLSSAAASALMQGLHSMKPPQWLIQRFSSGKAAPNLPYMPTWERLDDCVVRVSGLNPGLHTLQGTNTYLIGRGKARLLLDTGEGKPEYLSHLQSVMGEVGCEEITAIILTHYHFDHIGGVPQLLQQFGPVPVYKWAAHGDARTEQCSFAYQDISDGQNFACESVTLQAVRSPGHTADHMCFLLKEEGVLFSGDSVLGCGSAVFDDFTSYMASLRKCLALCKGIQPDGTPVIRKIYPGHGGSCTLDSLIALIVCCVIYDAQLP